MHFSKNEAKLLNDDIAEALSNLEQSRAELMEDDSVTSVASCMSSLLSRSTERFENHILSFSSFLIPFLINAQVLDWNS